MSAITTEGVSPADDPFQIVTSSILPDTKTSDFQNIKPIDKKVKEAADIALKIQSEKTTKKKRKKIKKVLFSTGKIIVGIFGACVGGPFLGPVAVGIGVSGAIDLTYQLSEIVDSGSAQDRIDEINRGHRDADKDVGK